MIYLTPLLVALTHYIGTDRVEILGWDLATPSIRAVALSPNGKLQLSASGNTAMITDAKSRGFYTAAPPGTFLQFDAVDDAGGVVGSYVAKRGSGTIPRAFWTTRSGLKLAHDVGPESFGFQVEGMSPDGIVMGMDVDFTGGNPFYPAFWDGHAVRRLPAIGQPSFASTMIPTGVIGSVTVRDGVQPFLYRYQDERYTSLPNLGGQSIKVTDATPDGRVLVGFSGVSNPTAVVYRDFVPSYVTCAEFKRPSSTLRAVADSGDLAVGQLVANRRHMAAIWTLEDGIMTVERYAREHDITLPPGWTYEDAVGISPGGECVFGTAIDAKRRQRPFLLWLDGRRPENKAAKDR